MKLAEREATLFVIPPVPREHLWLAGACALLGTLCLAMLAWEQTGTFPAAVVGSTIFLGPGLAFISLRRQRVTATAWLVVPVSLVTMLLGTRLLLALELYRPTPIAVGVAVVVAGTGAVPLVARREHHSEIEREFDRAMALAGAGARWRQFSQVSLCDHVRAHLWSWQSTCVAAIVAWLIGCRLTPTDDLTRLGLLGELSPFWYAGAFLGACAVVLALRRSSAQHTRPLVAATGVVVLILQGTAPLVYGAARYSWTYKHFGLADYFGRFHDNNRATVEIYHAFPAYFASLGVIAGTVTVNGLMVIARWWPLLIEISCVLLIRQMFSRINADKRLPWVAALLFAVANWIGQDYLSPQSVSLVLSLAIYAIVFRQFGWTARSDRPARPRWLSENALAVVAILACWIAIVVSHPLTPFLILPGLLIGFPLFGFRPRALPAVMAAIALGYVWLQRTIVEDQGIGRHLGSVVENVQSRGTTNTVVPTRVPEFKYFFLAAVALSMLVVVLAVIGSRTLMRSVGRRRFLGFACQAISPTLFLVVESYGQEGVLRAFLFALPWLSLLAAMPVVRMGSLRSRRPRLVVPALVAVVAVLSTVALFVRDLQYAVSASDVAVVAAFEDQNPKGALLIGAGIQPNRATATYYAQQYIVMAPPERLADGAIDTTGTLALMEAETEGYPNGVYLAFGPSLTNRAVFDGVMSKTDLISLERAVQQDPHWHLTFRSGASTLYRLDRS